MQRKQQVEECWVCVIFFACVHWDFRPFDPQRGHHQRVLPRCRYEAK